VPADTVIGVGVPTVGLIVTLRVTAAEGPFASAGRYRYDGCTRESVCPGHHTAHGIYRTCTCRGYRPVKACIICSCCGIGRGGAAAGQLTGGLRACRYRDRRGSAHRRVNRDIACYSCRGTVASAGRYRYCGCARESVCPGHHAAHGVYRTCARRGYRPVEACIINGCCGIGRGGAAAGQLTRGSVPADTVIGVGVPTVGVTVTVDKSVKTLLHAYSFVARTL